MTTYPFPTLTQTRAGFRRRLLAYLIDSTLVGLLNGVLGYLLGIGYALIGVQNETTLLLHGLLVGVVTAWLYFAGMESSPQQATLGKQLVGIKVTDLAGHRLSMEIATRRFFAKFLSGILLGAGYWMVALREDKQSLHDKLTGCLVLKQR